MEDILEKEQEIILNLIEEILKMGKELIVHLEKTD
jgi:hypothetical protein